MEKLKNKVLKSNENSYKFEIFFRQFFAFFVVSGIGWLLDFAIFLVLTSFVTFSPFQANFVSSLFAVTFVYFVSTTAIFEQQAGKSIYPLVIFWCYQIFSIYAYSIFLKYVIAYLCDDVHLSSNINAVAKILVTPLNLATNFFFMKILIFFMRK